MASQKFLLEFDGNFDKLESRLNSFLNSAKAKASQAASMPTSAQMTLPQLEPAGQQGRFGTQLPPEQLAQSLGVTQATFSAQLRQLEGNVQGSQLSKEANALLSAHRAAIEAVLRSVAKNDAELESLKAIKTTTASQTTREINQIAKTRDGSLDEPLRRAELEELEIQKKINRTSQRVSSKKETSSQAIASSEDEALRLEQERIEYTQKRNLALRTQAEYLARQLGADIPDLEGADPQQINQVQQQLRGALSERNREARRLASAQEAEVMMQEKRLALSAQGLTLEEFDAKEAARERATASKFGRERERAFLQQVSALQENTLNVERIGDILGDEAAMRETRLAAESAAKARAFDRDPLLREELVDSNVTVELERAQQERMTATRLSAQAEGEYGDNLAQAAASQERTNALVAAKKAQIQATDQRYIQAKQAEVKATEERTLAQLRAVGSEDISRRAAINVERFRIAEATKAAEFQQLNMNQVLIQEKARRIVAEKQYNMTLQKAVVQEEMALGLRGQGLFSRLTGWAAGGGRGGRGGGGMIDGGFGDGVGRGFVRGGLTSLRYSIPSILLFQTARSLRGVVKEAEDLQRVMVTLEAQFTAAFSDEPTERISERFNDFRNLILEVARDSGIAANEIARASFQVQGAFGEGTGADFSGVSGQTLVDENLRSLSRLAVVTDTEIDKLVDPLTAAAFAFDSTFEEIGNVTEALKDQTGVLSAQTVDFLGQIAPVASDAGLSLEEFATIAALTQQRSGRSGTALAEAYGRVLPAISEVRFELVELALQNESLNNQNFLEALATNQTGRIFLELVSSFESLNKQAQDFVITLLGGRREAAAIIPVFANSERFNELAESLDSSSGLLESRYEQILLTLDRATSRLSETWKQLGIAVFEAGLGDFLLSAVELMNSFIGQVSSLVQLFTGLNDVLGGTLNKLVLAAGALKTIQIVAGTSLLGGALGTAGRGGLLAGSAGFLGTTAGRVSLPLVAGSLVMQEWSNQNSRVNAAAEEFAEILREADRRTIENLIEERRSFWDKVRADGWTNAVSGLFFDDSIESVAAEELARRDSETLISQLMILDQRFSQGLVDSYLMTRNLTQEAYDDYLDEAAEMWANQGFGAVDDTTPSFGAEGSMPYIDFEKLIAELLDKIRADPTNVSVQSEIREFLEAARAAGVSLELSIREEMDIISALAESREVWTQAEAAIGAATLDIETAKRRYEAGDLSLREVVDSYNRYISALEQMLEIEPDDRENIQNLSQARKDRDNLYSKAMYEQYQLQAEIASLLGEVGGVSNFGDENRVDMLIALLNDPDFGDASQRRRVALDIARLQQSIAQSQLRAIEDAQEQLAFMEAGVEMPAEARVELIFAQLNQNNESWVRFLSGYGLSMNDLTDEMVRSFIYAIITGGQMSSELAAVFDGAGELVERFGAGAVVQIMQLRQAIALFVQRVNSVKEMMKGALAFAFDVANILASDPLESIGAFDPARIGFSQSDWDRASRAAQSAAKQDDFLQRLLAAQEEYARALVEGDPVRLAIVLQDQADAAFARAKDEAERIQARTARLRADRQLQDAMIALKDAEMDLIRAQLERVGDILGISQLGVDEARRALIEARAKFATGAAGEADVRQAEAALVRATTEDRDTRLRKALDDYAFLFEMERISRQEYLNYLIALRATLDPAENEQAIRDLDRTIKGLQDRAGGDLQFNLPDAINLPTLYEARRLGEAFGGPTGFTLAGGTGYNDNRVITINVTANTNADPDQIAMSVAQYVGEPQRFGTFSRRY